MKQWVFQTQVFVFLVITSMLLTACGGGGNTALTPTNSTVTVRWIVR
ncbi:MAG: hypothetical protein V4525_06080 [Pseudomonadota bacterium]